MCAAFLQGKDATDAMDPKFARFWVRFFTNPKSDHAKFTVLFIHRRHILLPDGHDNQHVHSVSLPPNLRNRAFPSDFSDHDLCEHSLVHSGHPCGDFHLCTDQKRLGYQRGWPMYSLWHFLDDLDGFGVADRCYHSVSLYPRDFNA